MQKEAQAGGVGMWAKGVPDVIISSLHSSAEEYAQEKGSAYNRTVDTRTGDSILIEHGETYATCQEVCEGPEADPVCMIYVPFEQRYRGQPDCIRVEKKKDAPEEPAGDEGAPAAEEHVGE